MQDRSSRWVGKQASFNAANSRYYHMHNSLGLVGSKLLSKAIVLEKILEYVGASRFTTDESVMYYRNSHIIKCAPIEWSLTLLRFNLIQVVLLCALNECMILTQVSLTFMIISAGHQCTAAVSDNVGISSIIDLC